jgi:hypothetical protein
MPMNRAPGPAAPQHGIPTLTTPARGTPQTGTPETGTPPTAIRLFGRQLRPKAVALAQDGHSLGEQRIYEELWRVGQPSTEGAKTVQISYRRLSDLTGLSLNTCKANLFALIDKLAIEELQGHTSVEARTYLVHPYSAILRRRQAAGLTHVIRGKGITFVDPETGIPTTGTPASGRPAVGVPRPGSPRPGRSRNVQSGIPDPAAHPIRLKPLREPTSTTLRSILQALAPGFDDAAAEQLWRDCRNNVPDVSAEEVAALFERKLPQSQKRGIENPNGFLVRSVARSCTPAAISALRSGRELPKEQEQEVVFEHSELEALLDDPNTPAALRELLKERLASK